MDNQSDKKIIIYQVLPRLFGNSAIAPKSNGDKKLNGCGKMSDFTTKALQEIKSLGVTHIWYTGVIEHATQTDYSEYGIRKDHPAVVKGKAGSPYAIKDYYDIDPDLATNVPNRIKEFENLVKHTHKEGMKVIMDFVGNHVARQYKSDAKPENVKDLGEEDFSGHAFDPRNNFYYLPGQKFEGLFDLQQKTDKPYEEFPAKVTGNDCFNNCPNINDWYETVKLNYGVDYCNGRCTHFQPIPNTWNKMLDILLYWSNKGIDGFRCDMAEMVPVEFWAWVIPQVKEKHPDIIFIAEVYNPPYYRLYLEVGKFDYLYDKVGLYDTLRSITCHNQSASALTNCWQSLDVPQDRMLNFMENHDEQRLASDYFALNGWKGVPAMIVSACFGTNPVMIYFGQELGENGMDNEGFSGRDGRTTIFDYWSIDLIRRWRNRGKFDGSLLKEDEKRLQGFYKKLLNLCNSEKAIQKGSFFDLMYVNHGSWTFNEHKQFAFFRKYENELILIIVNFNELPARVGLNIPSHAFEYLNLTGKNNYSAVDLLTGKEETVTLLPNRTLNTEIPAFGGKLLKIKL